MNFRVLDALPMLVSRYGETINKVPDDRNGRLGLENMKVMGFRTPSGKVLGLDVYPNNLERVRLWIEPPLPPPISGVTISATKICRDLDRRELSKLAGGKSVYLEAETRASLEELLAWYA